MTAGCTVVACCKKSVSDNGYETKNFPTDAYNAALKKQNPPYWAKHMTREQWDKLQEKKDDYGYGLGNAINSGVNNPGAGVGLYAGSLSTYMVLDEIFTPVLEDYHDLKPGQSHKSDMDAKKLKNLEPLDPAYTESIRIRIARNMKDMPLGTVISKEGRKEVEDKVIKATKAFEGELKGQYYSLESMTEAQQKQLITDHFLFKEGDDHLKHAGLNRDWPHARGIYHNDDKTFLTWVNEEDQLRIISMQKGGDVLKCFTRLAEGTAGYEKQAQFETHPRFGPVTSCPTNMGTGLRASIHVKLPKLSKDKAKMDAIADKYHVQIRGVDGEHSESKGGVYDISNRRRLGHTEVELVMDMYEGVKAMIAEEKKLGG